MDAFNGGETSPGPAVATPEQILDWVARDAETALHPSCTARMGVDDLAVVDPLTMRVHGVDGLIAASDARPADTDHLVSGHSAPIRAVRDRWRTVSAPSRTTQSEMHSEGRDGGLSPPLNASIRLVQDVARIWMTLDPLPAVLGSQGGTGWLQS